MNTGQACSHQPQVVHAQTVSSGSTPPSPTERRELLEHLGGKLQAAGERAFRSGGRVGLRMSNLGMPAPGDGTNAVHSPQQLPHRQRQLLRHLLRVVADGAVHFLVGERLAGVVGGAVGLAAAALGAGVGVEDLLPGEIGQLRHPELLAVLQVQLGELPLAE